MDERKHECLGTETGDDRCKMTSAISLSGGTMVFTMTASVNRLPDTRHTILNRRWPERRWGRRKRRVTPGHPRGHAAKFMMIEQYSEDEWKALQYPKGKP